LNVAIEILNQIFFNISVKEEGFGKGRGFGKGKD
jgi:hypothetical protein